MPNVTDHAERAHALYSPSASSRWRACHGSLKAQEGLVDTPSPAALWGTKCHEAAADILEKGVKFDRATAGLEDEQVEIVGEYVDFAYALLDELEAKHGAVTSYVETRFTHPEIPDYSGTCDLALIAGRTAHIVDLKSGFVPVQLRDRGDDINSQLGSYALLMVETLYLWDDIDEVVAWIVQPRVYSEPVKLRITRQELERFGEALEQDIRAIKRGDTTRVAGDHCKYCLAKGNCRTRMEYAHAQARLDFDMPLPDASQEFDDRELSDRLEEADMLAEYVDSIRLEALRRMERGRSISGFKIVPRRATARWTDVEAARADIASELTQSQMYRMTLRTPKQIETALIEAGSWLDIRELYKKESSGNTIARIDDPRPAAKSKASAAFD